MILPLLLVAALPWGDSCHELKAWSAFHWSPHDTGAQTHLFWCTNTATWCPKAQGTACPEANYYQITAFSNCLKARKASNHTVNIRKSWWAEYERLCRAPPPPPDPSIFLDNFETGDLTRWNAREP